MKSFEGTYENGVVRFPGPVDLPEGAKVTVVVIDASSAKPPLGCNSPELYEILNRSYDTEETDLASRVDELHPQGNCKVKRLNRQGRQGSPRKCGE